VQSASTSDGANIFQYAYGGAATNDEWQIVDIGSGYYKILNRNSSKAMVVQSASTSEGANIFQWTYGGTNTNDEWAIVDVGSGYFRITNRNSGKSAEVAGGGTANSTNIDQRTYSGATYQQWQIVSLGSSTPTATPTATPRSTPTATPRATPTSTPSGGGNFPSRFAAPYVETWNDNNLVNLSNSTGHKFWTLAFIISNGSCNPSWNGDTTLTGNGYNNYITNLRNIGGDVIVSHGGASGTELGDSCTSVSSLQAAYQKVISQFHLTWIDLDIEGGAESNTTNVDRRNQAIHNLQVANPSLRVSYTLAVDRAGLPSAQINLLKNAMSRSARVDVVNIMAMDYGPCYSDMGQAAVDAASATRSQLANIGLSAKVGVTPMIGTNDVTCEKFSTSDASVLVNYAQANSYIRLLAYWAQGADPNHSYINIFKTFH